MKFKRNSEQLAPERDGVEAALSGVATAGASPASDDTPLEVQELLEKGGPTRQKRMMPMLAGAAAVAVLAAGSFVAVRQFQSGSDGSGAASPEAAVQQLFEAMESEDFLGAVELVEPTERRTMVNPALDMMSELQRIGVVAKDFDMSDVAGVDIELSDMSYAPESLGGNVVRVAVDGQMTATGSAGELPYGPLIMDNLSDEQRNELVAEGEEGLENSVESLDDMGVVAVERGGQWYVSLWYSVAEGIRRDAGVAEMPAVGNGPTPTGGETPEGAVEAMASAMSDLDLEAMIAALDPEEAAAVYDYANLILGEIDKTFDADQQDEVDIDIERLDLRSETTGDDGQVWIEGFALSVEIANLGGLRVDTAADVCLVEIFEDQEAECMVSAADLDEMEKESGVDVGELAETSVRVHRVGDRWFISPMASLMQPLLASLQSLDQAQVQGWIDDPESLLAGQGMEGAGALNGLPLVFGGVAGLGDSADMRFEEVTTAAGDATDDGDWVEIDSDDWVEIDSDDWVVEGEDDDWVVEGEDDDWVVEGEDDDWVVEGDSDDNDDADTGFRLPDVVVPVDDQTTEPIATATSVPALVELTTVFVVTEFALAGTPAFEVKADVVEQRADVDDQALGKDDTDQLTGKVTAIDLFPGDVLQPEHFVTP